MGLVEMKFVLEGNKFVIPVRHRFLSDFFESPFVTFSWRGYLRILESAMAVAQMLMDAETIYIVSNELIAANSVPAALEGYQFVLKLLPNLPSAYHQIGLALSVSRAPCCLPNRLHSLFFE